MKFLAATLAVALVALPIAVKGQVLTFAAYNYEGCSGGIQEEWEGSGGGDHWGNFGAPRYSFSINHECDLTIWEGLNQGGGSVTMWRDEPGDGTCSWTSPDNARSFYPADVSLGYWSFSINC
ncbi:hypothetical protein CALVIDRAFT_524212 [Calocera viscosa TUFC12733]|uniref:Uncharacterized protein n=1 Tax=Calocera viscosa (strain TUFC12733) TaxID=1330018 RepID=A0A167RM98_CALVF|nr:hypothetical protein CALVIDRAFT_524212 [Calocera viscosa TUFC12733]